jgi:peptidoglycan/LPS O-acetylase OafA/YrhL
MLGKYAVCGFFILSGYWISLMYEKKYSLKENKITVFYISRLWRIFPMFYFFSIVGVFVTLKFYPDFPSVIMSLDFWPKISAFSSNLFILGNAFPKHRILGPSWSLEVEILFYLLFPFIALLIKKNKLNVIILTSLFFFISVYIILNYKTQFEYNGLPYIFLFLFGVLVYHYKLIFPKKLEVFSAAVFILILFFNYTLSYLHHALMEDGTYFNFVTLLLVVFSIPTLINSVYIKTNPKDKILGDLSFIVYLCHWVWIEAYYVIILDHPSSFVKFGYAIIIFFITAITSYVAYFYLDRPIEKKRHAWVNSRKNIIAKTLN